MVLHAGLFGLIGFCGCHSGGKGNACDEEAGGDTTDHDVLLESDTADHARA